MKWSEKPRPKSGDTRIIRRFLLEPTTLELQTRWLEFAKIRQEFFGGESMFLIPGRWIDLAWADAPRSIAELKEAIEKLEPGQLLSISEEEEHHYRMAQIEIGMEGLIRQEEERHQRIEEYRQRARGGYDVMGLP